MNHKEVRYTVGRESLAAVTRAIGEFVAAVREHEPGTSYHAYRIAGGGSFVHLMAFPDEEAERRHRVAPYTEAFVEILYPRCDESPEFRDLVEVAGAKAR